ncbi:MAG: serine/threonine-protein kinase [Clostridiaceae bacterium]
MQTSEIRREFANQKPEDGYAPGHVLAGLYRVECLPIKGGMSMVYRVHHNEWNVDLAMKRPYERLFSTEMERELFINECTSWINLGIHPNIVVCYYVREIDRIPSIFSEWMDAGSLRDWIGKRVENPTTNESKFVPGRLYVGRKKSEVVEQILDIAIQTARGLHYAHKHKLIHQDVKPDNILLTNEGVTKVADFGISRARHSAASKISISKMEADGTMITEGVGSTKEYCSPEQMEKRKVTRRTDVWSWALVVLELFLQERLWNDGTVGGYGYDRYCKLAKYEVPPGLDDLLRRCFQNNEADRPHDFADIEMELLVIYELTTGREYPRNYLEAVDETADSLNNHALSNIDIDKPIEAEDFWRRALRIDHNHLESIFNYSLFLWRNGSIDDMELLRRLNVCAQNHAGDGRICLMTGQAHLERGDRKAALDSLQRALDDPCTEPAARQLTAYAEGLEQDGVARTFTERASSITSIDFSPDRKRILTGCDDHGLILWNAESGEQIASMIDHTGAVRGVRFLADGRHAVSSGEDKDCCVRYWDLEEMKCIRRFSGHKDELRALAVSPDGTYTVTSSSDGEIRLWNNKSGEYVRSFTEHKKNCAELRFFSDGTRFASGCTDGVIKIWRLDREGSLATYEAVGGLILAIDVSYDGTMVASGDNEGMIHFWEVASGECVRTIRTRAGDIDVVRFSKDGSTIACACEDRKLRIFDTRTGCCQRTFAPQSRVLRLMEANDELTSIHTISGKEIVQYQRPNYEYRAGWVMNRIVSATERFMQEEHFQSVYEGAERALKNKEVMESLQLLDQARSIPGHEDDEKCLLLNITAGRFCKTAAVRSVKERSACETHPCRIRSVALSGDASFILAGADDATLKLFDTRELKCVRTFEGHTDKVLISRFSGDESRIASYSKDRTLRIWDASNGSELFSVKPYTGNYEVLAIALNANGTIAAAAGDDKKIYIYRVKDGEQIAALDGHADSVNALCISRDGKTLLSAAWDHTLKLWNLESKRLIKTLEGHTDDVVSVCLSADGKHALSGSFDTRMILWDLENETMIHAYRESVTQANKEPTAVTNVEMSASGRYLFAGYQSGQMELFDSEKHLSLRTFSGHTDGVCSSISQNGRAVVSGGKQGTLKVWEIDWVYEFPGWTDWDDQAAPYFEQHIQLYGSECEDKIDLLINTLQNNGFGCLRFSAVRSRLQKMCGKG